MNDREREELSPAESRVRETLRAWEPPRAETSFRERLKAEFVSGAFGERGLISGGLAERPIGERGLASGGPAERPIGERPIGERPIGAQSPEVLPPRSVRVRWPRPVARPALRWASALAAAAAIAIVAGVLNAPARWVALPSGGTGSLVIDGVAVPVSQTAEITRRIRPVSRVRLECVRDLDLVSEGALAMQLSPGTEVVMPHAPGRWFGRSSQASVEAGHLRITTGQRFHGAQLSIATPDAAIQITGTTLAVIAESSGTCVCVLEGVAKVGPRGGAMMPVAACSRCEIPRGGGEMVMGEMRDAERPKLADLRDRMASVLR